MYELISFDRDENLENMLIDFIYDLYKGDEKWIPPGRGEIRNLIRGEHPFRDVFKQKNFIIIKDKKAAGCVTGFVNPGIMLEGAPLGTVGCFECINDKEAAGKLFDGALGWLREQGAKTVWGPMNGTMWMQYRLMTAGFGDKPFYGEPYNKEYYLQLFQENGFEIIKHWKSTFTKRNWRIPALGFKIMHRYDSITREGYSIRKLDIQNFEKELETLCGLINDSFSGFLGYHEIDKDTFKELYGAFRSICEPDLIQFAVNPKGETVGFIVCIQDFSSILRKFGDRKIGAFEKAQMFLIKMLVRDYIFLYMGVSQKKDIPKGVGSALLYKVGKKVFLKGRGLSIGALISDSAPSLRFAEAQYDYIHEYVLLERSLMKTNEIENLIIRNL